MHFAGDPTAATDCFGRHNVNELVTCMFLPVRTRYLPDPTYLISAKNKGYRGSVFARPSKAGK